MSRLQHVVRNTALLMGMTVTVRLLGMVLTAAIGRRYLQEGLGQYGFLVSLYFVAWPAMDLGVAALALRTFARDDKEIPERFTDSLVAKIGLTLVMMLVGVGLLLLVRDDREVIVAGCLFLVGAAFSSFSDYFAAHFDSRQRMEFRTALEVGRQAFVVGAGLWTVRAGYGLIALGAAFAVAAGLQLACWCVLYGVYFPRPHGHLSFARSKEIIRKAAPFGQMTVLAAIFTRMELFVLSIMAGDSETGRFNAALAFIFFIMNLATALHDAVFPVFSGLHQATAADRLRVYERAQKLFLCAAVPLALGLCILGHPIVQLIFGTRFDSSAPLLMILSVGLGFHFLAMCANVALRALDRERVALRITVALCLISLLLDVVLIPFLGAEGAAVGQVVGKICWLALSYRALREIVPRFSVVPDALRVLSAGAIMAAPLLLLRQSSVFVLIPLGGVVYAAALLLTGAVTFSELRTFASTLRAKPVMAEASRAISG